MAFIRGRSFPPPPPPPRTVEYGWRTDEQEEKNDEDETSVDDERQEDPMEDNHSHHGDDDNALITAPPPAPLQEYLLTVHYYVPLHQSSSGEAYHQQQFSQESVHVQIYPTMTSEVLAQCVSQAVQAGSSLAGLFGGQDRIFHSFEHILSLPDPSRQAYTTMRPSHRVEPQEESASTIPLVVWVAGVVLALSMAHVGIFGGAYYVNIFETVVHDMFLGSVRYAHNWLFNLPFRELYRHGPPLIGWEGLALAEVCNRITHFGGRDFWLRNMNECQEIYASKEEAFLRTMRPISYTLMLLLLFWVTRHLVVAYGESKRNRTDRAVLEAYHAFQTLVRIASRQDGTRGNHQRMDRPR